MRRQMTANEETAIQALMMFQVPFVQMHESAPQPALLSFTCGDGISPAANMRQECVKQRVVGSAMPVERVTGSGSPRVRRCPRRDPQFSCFVRGPDDDVLFLGTRFSNLYTAVDTPA